MNPALCILAHRYFIHTPCQGHATRLPWEQQPRPIWLRRPPLATILVPSRDPRLCQPQGAHRPYPLTYVQHRGFVHFPSPIFYNAIDGHGIKHHPHRGHSRIISSFFIAFANPTSRCQGSSLGYARKLQSQFPLHNPYPPLFRVLKNPLPVVHKPFNPSISQRVLYHLLDHRIRHRTYVAAGQGRCR